MKNNREEVIDKSLTGAAIGSGGYGAYKGVKGIRGKEKLKGHNSRNVKFVIEGSDYANKDLGASTLTQLKERGGKVNEDLIGILGGKTLIDPKYRNEALSKYTTGKVLNDFPSTQTDIEDHWNFYKNHKDTGMLPETERADNFKSIQDVEKRFGKNNYIAKKRMAYASKGVLTDEKKQWQLDNLNGGSSRPIRGFKDLVGDKDFIFQKKVNIKTPKDEYRVTVADKNIVDVLQRGNDGELDYKSRPINPWGKKAKTYDKLKKDITPFVNNIKTDSKGVHALDVVFDSNSNAFKILESNAAGGANIRETAPWGSAWKVKNFYNKGIVPMTNATKRSHISKGVAAIGAGGALYGTKKVLENKNKIKNKKMVKKATINYLVKKAEELNQPGFISRQGLRSNRKIELESTPELKKEYWETVRAGAIPGTLLGAVAYPKSRIGGAVLGGLTGAAAGGLISNQLQHKKIEELLDEEGWKYNNLGYVKEVPQSYLKKHYNK